MSVLFTTPCYGGMITAQHFQSCMNLKEELTRQGIVHDWLIGWNESLVHRGRMEMAANFLKTDFRYLFWLDADIDFTPEDVARIYNLDADIGVGVYALKKRDVQWFAAWHKGELVKDLNQFTGPIEVEYAGTGFMCIKREVIEALAGMVETYDGPDGPVPALFMTPIVNRTLLSEDYSFCKLARDAGFKIIMDPAVRLGHIGQYRYGG